MRRTYSTPNGIAEALLDLRVGDHSGETVDIHTIDGYYLTDKPVTGKIDLGDETRILIGERFSPSLLVVVSESEYNDTYTRSDIQTFLHGPSNEYVRDESRGEVSRIVVTY